MVNDTEFLVLLSFKLVLYILFIQLFAITESKIFLISYYASNYIYTFYLMTTEYSTVYNS